MSARSRAPATRPTATENREPLVQEADANVSIDAFDGYLHSSSTAMQADDIIGRRVNFLIQHLDTDRDEAR